MNELELTWSRVFYIWWAFAWRGLVYVMVPCFIFGVAMGILFVVFKLSIQENMLWLRCIGAIYGFFMGFWIIKNVFSSKIANFRIALVSVSDGGKLGTDHDLIEGSPARVE